MKHERVCATDTALPDGALDRLALFGEWTGTTPPKNILEDLGDGPIFTNDILSYAQENGLSLDWFFLGDERGLVMRAHNAAKERPASRMVDE
jgi:hypothetical protein